MASDRPYNVLFLCTGNSARSILAEAILNRLGDGRFKGYSAGSFPKGVPHPQALKVVADMGFVPAEFRSKSWDEFAGPGAPEIDFIVTVCDNAAGEVCPIWPGRPISSHWGLPDPAAIEEPAEAVARAFGETAGRLTRRIEAFIALPLAELDKAALKKRMDEIGRIEDAAVTA